jgi:hypothetical protein
MRVTGRDWGMNHDPIINIIDGCAPKSIKRKGSVLLGERYNGCVVTWRIEVE